MPKLRAILLVIVLFFALCFLKDKANKNGPSFLPGITPLADVSLQEQIEKNVGEKITYDVKLGHLTLGASIFKHLPTTELNGSPAIVMVFETSLARFKDTEVIYSDPQTLLPIKIERNVINWFTNEKITEDYNQKDFTVTISKKKGGKTESLLIKKDNPIHNAILLPQQIRRLAKLNNNEIIIANLPNRKYEMKLVSTDEVKVPAGTFKAYHFKSMPAQIDIWISADERKLPIKIQSNGIGFGYLLVLKEYSK